MPSVKTIATWLQTVVAGDLAFSKAILPHEFTQWERAGRVLVAGQWNLGWVKGKEVGGRLSRGECGPL